jgi:hypothetical protein
VRWGIEVRNLRAHRALPYLCERFNDRIVSSPLSQFDFLGDSTQVCGARCGRQMMRERAVGSPQKRKVIDYLRFLRLLLFKTESPSCPAHLRHEQKEAKVTKGFILPGSVN